MASLWCRSHDRLFDECRADNALRAPWDCYIVEGTPKEARESGWLERELASAKQSIAALPHYLGGGGNRWAAFTEAELESLVEMSQEAASSLAYWNLPPSAGANVGLIGEVIAELERRRA